MNKIFITALLFNATFHANNFNSIWREMQQQYADMCKELERNSKAPTRNQLYHPQWQKFSAQIKQLITGSPNQNFLQYPAIRATMVRSGMNVGQSYEICYLTRCISENTKQLLSTYKEPVASNLIKECKEFNCSANALGQLYYAARILEQIPQEHINTIVEFGGGYGCLAHIFKSLLPTSTIYIIDIPELLSIQYLYLKTALPNEKIHVHISEHLTTAYEPGIHLIPTHNMRNLNLQADLFVSNFALSEVTAHVQKTVAKKEFFNAHTCYITGQLDGWGSFGFEQHDTLLANIRSFYQQAICQPFHLFLDTIKSYEIIGSSPHNQNKKINNNEI